MSDLDPTAVHDALEAAYRNITTVANGLGETELMLPSRCAGWALGDVLYHQLLDARRALRTFASPSADPPDADDIGYWRSYSPQSGEHEAAGGAEAAAHARHVRIVAAAYPPGALAWEWRETAAAACRAARACPHRAVTTQGHVLRTADFIATLVVEAAVLPRPDRRAARIASTGRRLTRAGAAGSRRPARDTDAGRLGRPHLRAQGHRPSSGRRSRTLRHRPAS
jgi:hypothetical protein